MKYKNNKAYKVILVISSITLLINIHIKAIAVNNQKSIIISSMNQIIDINNHTMIFTDKVLIKYDVINIHADKVIINFSKNKNKILEIYGTPVSFYQLDHNNILVSGHALNIRYETLNNIIILFGKAHLKYLNNKIKGDQIKYLFEKKQVEALSNPGSSITTIISSKDIK